MIIYKENMISTFKEVDLSVRNILILMGKYEPLADESLLFKVSFVLRELLNNSVEHGNNFDVGKKISCIVNFESPNLMIEISDEGDGFVRNDAYFESLDNEKRERRRGLKLIEDLNFKIEIENSTIKLNLDVS